MPVYNLNMHNKNITNCNLITTNDISGNYNQGIDFDPSSNIVFNRNNSTIATLGSKTIASTSRTGLDVNGSYYSNGVSAIQIPADTSNNRPSTGLAGYIRYNTSTNVIEYWNNSTNTWAPISEPSPSISSISPLSVPVPDISCGNIDVSVNIIGENFGSQPPVVYFIGSDAVERLASSVTNVVAGSQVRAILPSSVFDASNQEPFAVKLVSASSSFSVTTIPPNVIDINAPPYFITQSPLSDISNNSLVTSFTLAGQLDISAGDIDGNTLTFTSPSPNPISDIQSGALTINSSSGAVTGTLSNPGANTTYNFNVKITDTASNCKVKLYSFSFTVPQLVTFTTSGLTTSTTYLTSGSTIDQQGSASGGIVIGGWTIVAFTAGSAGTLSFNNYTGQVRFLMVGGGGPGGTDIGGGGGGGGILDQKQSFSASTAYVLTVATSTASTIGNATGSISGSTTSITGTGLIAPIIAGGGGGGGNEIAGDDTSGMNGSAELGGGGGGGARKQAGGTGDSYGTGRGGNGGTNTIGGTGSHTGCGGGGGLYINGSVSSGNDVSSQVKTGANGKQSNIDGNNYYYGGGGGGTSYSDSAAGGSGGLGGGGGGSGANNGGAGGSGGGSARNAGSSGQPGQQSAAGGAGGANTGGGGGGGTEDTGRGGSGASGIIIFRFPSYI